MRSLQYPGIRYQQIGDANIRDTMRALDSHLKAMVDYVNAAISTDHGEGLLRVVKPIVVPAVDGDPSQQSTQGVVGQLARAGPSAATANSIFLKTGNDGTDTDWVPLPTGATGFADPTGAIGLTMDPGSGATYMRSSAHPPLSQNIAPDWTAPHKHSSYVDYAEMAAPVTPAANIARLYAKDKAGVSSIFFLQDDGTEIDLSRAGSGTFQPFDADLSEIAALANVRGDLLLTDSGSNWTRLPVGAVNSMLFSDGADAAWGLGFTPTVTGVWTFSAQDVHNAGVSLGTSGVLTSAITTDAPGAIGLKYKPATALTADTQRDWHSWQDSSGNVLQVIKGDGSIEFGGRGTTGGYLNIAGTRTTADFYGVNFITTFNNAGSVIANTGWATSVAGALFGPKDISSATWDTIIGGVFGPQNIAARTHARIGGGLFVIPTLPAGTFTYGDMFGWHIQPMSAPGGATVRTVNNMYGGKVPTLLVNATKPATTNVYGLWLEEQKNGSTASNAIFCENATTGYKAIAIRDQNAAVGSDTSGVWDFFCTTAVRTNCDVKLGTVGKGLYIKEGTNATSGIATLVAGAVTVATTKVTANSRIHVTVNGVGVLANLGSPYENAATRVPGTSFDIKSTNVLDTSSVVWLIMEPA